MPLTKKSDAGDYVDDFAKSKAPQFKGKTEKEKRDMAVAAYLSKKREQKEGVLDEKGPKIGVDSLKVIRAQDKAMKPAKPKRMTSTQKSLAAIRAKESTEHPNCGTPDCCMQCDPATPEINLAFVLFCISCITSTLLLLNSPVIQNVTFFVLLILPLIHLFIYQMKVFNLNDPASCFKAFKSNNFFGLIILINILISQNF